LDAVLEELFSVVIDVLTFCDDAFTAERVPVRLVVEFELLWRAVLTVTALDEMSDACTPVGWTVAIC
jgi:hypothetical protein